MSTKITPARTVQIPATADDGRYEIEPDETSECPLDWGWEGQFYLLGCGRASILEKYDSDSDTMAAFAELADRHGITRAQEIIKRRLGEDIQVKEIAGHAPRDWWDIAWTGDQPIDALEQWLRGDVWVVTDTKTDETLSGIYADDEAAALQYFLAEHQQVELAPHHVELAVSRLQPGYEVIQGGSVQNNEKPEGYAKTAADWIEKANESLTPFDPELDKFWIIIHSHTSTMHEVTLESLKTGNAWDTIWANVSA